jgi:hypothetical protein
MSKVDICYIASNGFSVRMITQTDLLGKLAKSGKKIALICPDRNDPVVSAYCREHAIQLEEFDEKNEFGNEHYMFKRKYFLEHIEGNAALMEKHMVSTAFATSRHPIRRIRPYYYWWLYKLIPAFPFIRERFVRQERKYLVSQRAKELIDKLAPRKLVSTYPVSFNEAVLLHYGNQDPRIETWIHLLSWDNITCKGRWPERADKFIAWGPIMEEELKEFYQAQENQIFTCGVPHFDLHVKIKHAPQVVSLLAEAGLNPRSPYLFFGMSSPRFAPGEIEIVERLAKEIDAGQFGDLQLLVRPHPQNVTGNLADSNWLPRLQRLSVLKSVAVDFPRLVKDSKISWNADKEDMIRLANFITGSVIVLNSGSTISIDGLIHEKPVILTSFDGEREYPYWRSARRLIDYPHLKKLVEEGGVEVVRSFTQLRERIAAYRSNPERNLHQRNATLSREIFKNDGLATDRVTNTLLNSL